MLDLEFGLAIEVAARAGTIPEPRPAASARKINAFQAKYERSYFHENE